MSNNRWWGGVNFCVNIISNNYMWRNETGKKISEALKRAYKEGRRFPTMLGKHQSKESIDKQRVKIMGEKNGNWKGGTSTETEKRMGSFEWRHIRKEVYKRDKWTCQICGVHCKNGGDNKISIQCHHIVPYRIIQDNSMSNLITLCNSCHGKEEQKYYNRLKDGRYGDTENIGG